MTAVATRPQAAAAMKWWGWGDEGVAFSHEDKPAFGPFIKDKLGIDVERVSECPPDFGDLDVPAPQIDASLRAALEAVTDVSDDPLDRIVHARGKSLRDLVRQRRGDLGRIPDDRVAIQPPSVECENESG